MNSNKESCKTSALRRRLFATSLQNLSLSRQILGRFAQPTTKGDHTVGQMPEECTDGDMVTVISTVQ